MRHASKAASPKADAPKATAPKTDSSNSNARPTNSDEGEVLLALADVQDAGPGADKDEPIKKEPAKTAPTKEADAKQPVDKKSAEKAAGETKPGEKAPAATEAKAGAPAAPAGAEVDVEQERKQIEAENKRLQDEYDAKFYSRSPPVDPANNAEEHNSNVRFRCLRGGSWDYGPLRAIAAFRNKVAPDDRRDRPSFRLARSL